MRSPLTSSPAKRCMAAKGYMAGKRRMAGRIARLLPVAALFFALLPACARDLEVMRADINDLKSETYSSKKEASEARDSLALMGRELEAVKASIEDLSKQDPSASLKESQATLYLQVQGLLSEVQSLKGSIEEQKHSAEAAMKKSLESEEKTASGMAAIEKSSKDLEARLASLEESLKKLAEESKAKEEAAPDALKSADKAYDEAHTAFIEKKYPEAREKFYLFLKAYPDHRLAGNAQFWVGETYYGERTFESAILAYEEVIKNYKDSPKLPAAMLKQAMAFIEIGDKKAGEVILRELLEKHPQSEQAPLAKRKLDELSPPQAPRDEKNPKKK